MSSGVAALDAYESGAGALVARALGADAFAVRAFGTRAFDAGTFDAGALDETALAGPVREAFRAMESPVPVDVIVARTASVRRTALHHNGEAVACDWNTTYIADERRWSAQERTMQQHTERAEARAAVCRELLARIRVIETARPGAPIPRQAVLDALLEFVERQRQLFPDEDFASPRAHSRFHPLVEGGDTPYGLYYGVTRPGKEAAPHDHGLWGSTVAFSGVEVNTFWTRTDDGGSETRATVVKTHEIPVEPGRGMFLGANELHGTVTTGTVESRLLHLYERPFAEFPPVVFYHPELGTRRRLPASAGRTIRGG